MNDAKFYLLGKLLKDHRTISKNDYRSIVFNDSTLKESIDYKEFDDELFFTDAYTPLEIAKGGLHDKCIIKDEYDDIYKMELAKRTEKIEDKKLQSQLTKSSIRINYFIQLTFLISLLGLGVQIYTASMQSEQTQIQRMQLQADTLQSQRLKLQDSVLIQHSHDLEILKAASLQNKLRK